VERKTLPSAKFRKNTPEQVPVIIIARLAVAVDAHGYGLGSGLLKDALLRCIQVADTVGVRAVLVHAIDDEAVGFYRKHAFMESPLDPRTLLLPVEAIKGAASG
jgi:GNAT superfamily N-acetyltransferase